MGTTAEKGAYTLQTKSLLKDKINNLGGNIDSETTFREYVEKLQDVYDNYPKTSYGEGTSVTLENCNKGKLDFEDDKVGYGQTSQESTEGYNMYNATLASQTREGITITRNADGTYDFSGTCTVSNYVDIHFGTNQLDNSKNFRISAVNSVPSGIDFYATVTKSGGTTDYPQINTGTGAVANNPTSVLIFARIYNGAVLNNLVVKPMVSSDTSKSYNDFEPYTNGASPNPTYPQPISSVTGNQVVRVRGKNYCDINTKLENAIINTNSITSGIFTLLYKRLSKGNYTISSTSSMQFVYCFTDTIPTTSTSNITRVVENSITSKTFNVPNDCYICYRILFYNGSTLEEVVDLARINSEVQIEQGSSATTYEPYITPITKTLALGTREFCKMVNNQDCILLDLSNGKFYEHKAVEKIRLTRDMGWTTGYVTNDSWATTYIRDNYDVITTESTDNIISNYAKGIRYAIRNTYVGACVYFELTGVLQFRNSGFTTLNDFLTFLDNNYVYAYFITQTPTDTEITNTTLIEQLEEIYNLMSITGTTIIEVEGDLPMIIKVRALKGES